MTGLSTETYIMEFLFQQKKKHPAIHEESTFSILKCHRCNMFNEPTETSYLISKQKYSRKMLPSRKSVVRQPMRKMIHSSKRNTTLRVESLHEWWQDLTAPAVSRRELAATLATALVEMSLGPQCQFSAARLNSPYQITVGGVIKRRLAAMAAMAAMAATVAVASAAAGAYHKGPLTFASPGFLNQNISHGTPARRGNYRRRKRPTTALTPPH